MNKPTPDASSKKHTLKYIILGVTLTVIAGAGGSIATLAVQSPSTLAELFGSGTEQSETGPDQQTKIPEVDRFLSERMGKAITGLGIEKIEVITNDLPDGRYHMEVTLPEKSFKYGATWPSTRPFTLEATPTGEVSVEFDPKQQLESVDAHVRFTREVARRALKATQRLLAHNQRAFK